MNSALQQRFQKNVRTLFVLSEKLSDEELGNVVLRMGIRLIVYGATMGFCAGVFVCIFMVRP